MGGQGFFGGKEVGRDLYLSTQISSIHTNLSGIPDLIHFLKPIHPACPHAKKIILREMKRGENHNPHWYG